MREEIARVSINLSEVDQIAFYEAIKIKKSLWVKKSQEYEKNEPKNMWKSFVFSQNVKKEIIFVRSRRRRNRSVEEIKKNQIVSRKSVSLPCVGAENY